MTLEDVRAQVQYFESVRGGEIPPILYRLREAE